MYAPRIIRPALHWRTAAITACVCCVVISAVAFAAWHASRRVPLPASIKNQVHFPIFVPSQGITVNAASYKYDPGQQVLSFTGRMDDGQSVTFAEQPAPSSFTDIPDFYPKFLEKLYDYQSFDCLQGTMHLTHPKNAGQAAVMSAKGVLLFARVAQDESAIVWKVVCNNLQLYSW